MYGCWHSNHSASSCTTCAALPPLCWRASRVGTGKPRHVCVPCPGAGQPRASPRPAPRRSRRRRGRPPSRTTRPCPPRSAPVPTPGRGRPPSLAGRGGDLAPWAGGTRRYALSIRPKRRHIPWSSRLRNRHPYRVQSATRSSWVAPPAVVAGGRCSTSARARTRASAGASSGAGSGRCRRCRRRAERTASSAPSKAATPLAIVRMRAPGVSTSAAAAPSSSAASRLFQRSGGHRRRVTATTRHSARHAPGRATRTPPAASALGSPPWGGLATSTSGSPLLPRLSDGLRASPGVAARSTAHMSGRPAALHWT